MSTTKKRPFVCRGFNIANEQFANPTGRLESKATAETVVVDTATQAIDKMLTNPAISEMSASAMFARGDADAANFDTFNNFLTYRIRLTFEPVGIGTSLPREIKTPLREAFQLWSEKSRVKNFRGFRASAIQEPRVEKKNDDHVYTSTAIVGTGIAYREDTAKIVELVNTDDFVMKDRADLESIINAQLKSASVYYKVDELVIDAS